MQGFQVLLASGLTQSKHTQSQTQNIQFDPDINLIYQKQTMKITIIYVALILLIGLVCQCSALEFIQPEAIQFGEQDRPTITIKEPIFVVTNDIDEQDYDATSEVLGLTAPNRFKKSVPITKDRPKPVEDNNWEAKYNSIEETKPPAPIVPPKELTKQELEKMVNPVQTIIAEELKYRTEGKDYPAGTYPKPDVPKKQEEPKNKQTTPKIIEPQKPIEKEPKQIPNTPQTRKETSTQQKPKEDITKPENVVKPEQIVKPKETEVSKDRVKPKENITQQTSKPVDTIKPKQIINPKETTKPQQTKKPHDTVKPINPETVQQHQEQKKTPKEPVKPKQEITTQKPQQIETPKETGKPLPPAENTEVDQPVVDSGSLKDPLMNIFLVFFALVLMCATLAVLKFMCLALFSNQTRVPRQYNPSSNELGIVETTNVSYSDVGSENTKPEESPSAGYDASDSPV